MAYSRTLYYFCCHLLHVCKDELAGGALSKVGSTNTPISAFSYALISAPARTPAPFEGTYTDVNLQKATKLALNLFI